MKVLIVFNQPAPYKVNLFNELAKYVELDVIFERKTCSNRDPLFYKDNKYNFNVRFLKHGSFSEEQSFTFELRRYIKKHYDEYDYVIMNGYSTISEMITINYLIKHKLRFILMVNGGLIHNDSGLKRKLKHRFISNSHKILSPCIEADNYLLHYGAKKRDILHYPNSTIFEKEVLNKLLTDKEIQREREKLKLPIDKKIIICPTQFIPRKNNIALINTFKQLDNCELLLIGSGVEENLYKKELENKNITNVQIIPYKRKEELFKYYQVCDSLITLSKEDIYGHTINEAMSQGLPVISTDKVVAATHLIKNNENGYLISLNKLDILPKIIETINHKQGGASLQISKENTIEQSANKIIKELKELK